MNNPSEHILKGILRNVEGDATLPQGSNLKYLVQALPANGEYPKEGFASTLSSRWPKVSAEYRQYWRERYGKLRLGDIQPIQIQSDLVVVNMIAIDDDGVLNKDALKQCFALVGKEVVANNSSVHMHVIEDESVNSLIESELLKRGIGVTIYETPSDA